VSNPGMAHVTDYPKRVAGVSEGAQLWMRCGIWTEMTQELNKNKTTTRMAPNREWRPTQQKSQEPREKHGIEAPLPHGATGRAVGWQNWGACRAEEEPYRHSFRLSIIIRI
jgi:hypothetical protein